MTEDGYVESLGWIWWGRNAEVLLESVGNTPKAEETGMG